METITKEQAQEYVDKYNSSLPQMPMSFVVYRELLGLFYFVAFNRRMREFIKRIIQVTDKEEISDYNELIAVLDSKTLENVFDADEIDEFFKIKVKDEE